MSENQNLKALERTLQKIVELSKTDKVHEGLEIVKKSSINLIPSNEQIFEVVKVGPKIETNLINSLKSGKKEIVKTNQNKINIIGFTPVVSAFNPILQFFFRNIVAISLSVGLLVSFLLLCFYFKDIRELVSNSEYKNIAPKDEFLSKIEQEKEFPNIINSFNKTEEISKEFIIKSENKTSPTVSKLVQTFLTERNKIDLNNLTNDINEFRVTSHEELLALWIIDIQNRIEGLKIIDGLKSNTLTKNERKLLEIKGFELREKIIETAEKSNLLYDNIVSIEKAKKNLLKQYQKEKNKK